MSDQAILKARCRSNFITIPQTTIDYEKLHKALTKYTQLVYVITKLEQHKDEGLHIHIVVKAKSQFRLNSLETIIREQEGTIGGHINYQVPKEFGACVNYLKKQDTSIDGKPFLEYGMYEKKLGRPSSKSKYEDDGYLSQAFADAKEGDVDKALDLIAEHDPKMYLQYLPTIKSNLESMNDNREYYDLPDISPENVKLTPSQQKVWDILQSQPKARRIIWISGDYGSGKSFLFNYITENHPMRCYNAGQSASLDNVCYGYDQEGVIAWDLPRTYKFDDYGDALANVIEKFSDFGQSVTSKKYSGKTQKVRGHAIVFSNSDPIEQLAHRDIVHIQLEKDTSSSSKVEQPKKNKKIVKSSHKRCDAPPPTLDEEQGTQCNDEDLPVEERDY